VLGNEKLGISKELAARIGIAMAGVWWAGFTLLTARLLHEPPATANMPEKYRRLPWVAAYAAVGIERTWKTTRRAVRYKHLVLFLIAFMFYNDGIQTVISMATTYGTVELKLPTWALMVTLLIIQFVAMVGSLIFSKLSQYIGTKPAIMLALGGWSGVVVYAYFITTMTEFFILGMIVGLVMGGAQALSRSYYSTMVPEAASAEFFGFYTVFSKFSAIWGPFAFAIIKHLAGSSRIAVASLIVFFIIGIVLLAFVDETKAREAKLAEVF
jgi:MFS transporter, UMF1 family